MTGPKNPSAIHRIGCVTIDSGAAEGDRRNQDTVPLVTEFHSLCKFIYTANPSIPLTHTEKASDILSRSEWRVSGNRVRLAVCKNERSFRAGFPGLDLRVWP